MPARVAVTLRRGTWHAGPLFDLPGSAAEGQGGISQRAGGAEEEEKEKGEDNGVDFLNLELSDTNSKDRTLSVLIREDGTEAEIEVLWPTPEL